MTSSNAIAGPSNPRPSTTKLADATETPRAFATLTNRESLDDEDQDDSMDWEEVDLLGTGVPEVQPIIEVEVTVGEKQRVETSRK
jgi:hypothetical protein